MERTIFLHFLNREACEACNTPHNFQLSSSIIDIMLISHCSKMAVNISQLLEYCGDNAKFLSYIFELTDNGLITLISSAPTIDEFIVSRRQIYDHDRQRYPMYFDDNAPFATRFRIGQINTTATTKLLTRKIFGWEDNLFDPVNRVMNKSDQETIRDSRELVQQITMQHQGQAITRAMYRVEHKGKRLSPDVFSAAGRMISGIYIDQYRSEYEYAQCSGIPGLEYYDQMKFFPFYDYSIANHLCRLLGYYNLKIRNWPNVRDQINSLYNTEEHRDFVGWFNVLVDCVFHHVITSANEGKLSAGNLSVVREQIINVLSAFRRRVDSSSIIVNNLSDFFRHGTDIIKIMGKFGRNTGDAFAKKWAENMEPLQPNTKILILTATDIEDQMLLRELQSDGFAVAEPRQLGNVIARVFSPRRGIQVFHVRSNAGSGGSAGSTLTAKDAIDALEPDFVVSVGIAFGIDKTKQKMHDILISTRIWNYESARLTGDVSTPRGEELPASSILLDACRHVRKDDDNVRFGTIASGEKLVDSATFIESLKTQKDQLIGGEMEGSGISAACQRTKTNWIMMKSICDWGEKKNKKFQAKSAAQAASFCVRVINYLSTIQ